MSIAKLTLYRNALRIYEFAGMRSSGGLDDISISAWLAQFDRGRAGKGDRRAIGTSWKCTLHQIDGDVICGFNNRRLNAGA